MPALLAFLAGCAGALLLLASTAFHWFGVPGAVTLNGALTIVTLEPRVTLVCKAACLATLLTLALMVWRGASLARRATVLTLLFILLLIYPYFVITWSPDIAAQASWLNTQHENLSWLGGDIFNEQEYKDIGFKRQLYVTDAERQVGVFRLPNWSPYMVQWGRVNDLMEWLGYSNRYCQFVAKGWFAALAGTLCLLLSLCRGREGLRYPVARAIGFTGLYAAVPAFVLALTPPMLSGFLMMQARHATQRGERPAALRWLERSAMVLPAIRQDTYFVAQKGLLQADLGLDAPEARLCAAQRLDKQGFAAQARARFEQLVRDTAPGSPIQREALREILHMGIDDLNSGSAPAAITSLLYVLDREPCNLKALYVMQLAGLRTARFDLMRTSAARMADIYQRFNTLTKAPVLAACSENLEAAAYQEDDLTETLAQRNAAIGRPQP